MKWIIVFIAGVVLGGFGGYKYFEKNDKVQISKSEIRTSGVKYTNPLLECEGEEKSIGRELIPFKKILEDKITRYVNGGKVTQVSLYFRDLKNGPWIGINQDELFAPASLLKVPILMAYYKMAEQDVSILEKQITYEEEVVSEEEVRTPITLKLGKKYTIGELIDRMIIFSDNAAAHILYKELDPRKFAEPYSYLELEVPFTKPGEYYLPVRKYASFFRLLFNASYLSPDASERALALLAKVQFTLGIRAGVPKEVEVANKYGERSFNDGKENQLHDCGIVYYPNYPYLICIMTRGNDIQQLPEVVSGLSKVVYDEVDKQRKIVN
jgi:beta-lactamase class A